MRPQSTTPRVCLHCNQPFFFRKGDKPKFCSKTCHYAHARHSPVVVAARFWARVDKSGDCWLWRGRLDRDGYGLFPRGHSDTVRAHRFAYELAHGPIPVGLLVLHGCPSGDNPACVNPAHLSLGTVIENTRDRVSRGRSATGERSGPRLHPERLARGERSPHAKLTEDAVREIRRLSAAGGATQQTLAERFGVSGAKISQVVRRKNWKHVA